MPFLNGRSIVDYFVDWDNRITEFRLGQSSYGVSIAIIELHLVFTRALRHVRQRVV